MMTKILSYLLILFTLLGCSVDNIKHLASNPELKSIRLESFSPAENQITFELAVYNPNLFDIPISGIEGNITLNQIAIGKFIANNTERSLKARSTQSIIVPLKLNPDATMKAVKNALFKRTLNYTLAGTVDTSTGTIPFIKKGKLSVQNILSSFLQ